MSTLLESYTIYALGDNALTIDFGNKIDREINKQVMAIYAKLKQLAFPFIVDLVPAYSSLTIYYNIAQVLNYTSGYQTAYDGVSVLVENVATSTSHQEHSTSRLIKVPVCYSPSYGLDITLLAKQNGISVPTVIQIHSERIYEVYMIGFMPGFPYMGEVDDRIVMPRKVQPRLKVEAGAVGIAGKQTGIYPQASPGGWQIIGCTPLTLFNPTNKEPSLLKPGDRVQFYSITEDEFTHFKARSL